ncbi:hypothetical protein MHYP_G00015630 [Metynnis hypsauchen]
MSNLLKIRAVRRSATADGGKRGQSQQRRGRSREERKKMNEQTLAESNGGVREELRVHRESRADREKEPDECDVRRERVSSEIRRSSSLDRLIHF